MIAFVTGSTGLLGHNLTRQLLESGWTVRALVRSPKKAAQLFQGLNLEIVEGDMENVAGFTHALSGVDAVFHTAAFFREYYQPGNHWDTMKRINIDATLELIGAAERAGVTTFVHTSSSGTIGVKPDKTSGDENTPADATQLKNLYFRSKVEGDAAIKRWLEAEDRRMKLVTILPGWMIAPRDAAPTSAGELILNFMARKISAVLDAGTTTVDARDVAAAMLGAVDKGRSGERYIVGGRLVLFDELFSTLERVSGVKAPSLKLPNWVAILVAGLETRVSTLRGVAPTMPIEGVRTLLPKDTVSSAKAVHELGVTFRPLEETLRDTVAWFRDNGYVKNAGVSSSSEARRV
jgi:dihydroflavonol-4-reductase